MNKSQKMEILHSVSHVLNFRTDRLVCVTLQEFEEAKELVKSLLYTLQVDYSPIQRKEEEVFVISDGGILTVRDFNDNK
jgi:hypothetical protein